jgi:hypothetical protein
MYFRELELASGLVDTRNAKALVVIVFDEADKVIVPLVRRVTLYPFEGYDPALARFIVGANVEEDMSTSSVGAKGRVICS